MMREKCAGDCECGAVSSGVGTQKGHVDGAREKADTRGADVGVGDHDQGRKSKASGGSEPGGAEPRKMAAKAARPVTQRLFAPSSA